MGGTAQRMRSIRASAPNKRPETRVGLAPTSSLFSKQQYRVPDSPTGSHLQKPHSIKKHEQVRHQRRRFERNYAAGATERPEKENNQTGYPAL